MNTDDLIIQLGYSFPNKLSEKERQTIENNVRHLLEQQREEIINLIEEYKVEKEPLCEQNVLINLIITKIKNL